MIPADNGRGVRGSTILLSSGRYYDLAEPGPLTIEEVAHALAHICRFTGHCKDFYSVAQHSVLVSYLVPPEHSLQGLLHDAVEAVVGDMASPLKALVPEYKAIEVRCEQAILAGFGLAWPLHDEVKTADLIALRTEQRDLMGADHHTWLPTAGLVPDARRITVSTTHQAKSAFLRRYRYLTTKCPNEVTV